MTEITIGGITATPVSEVAPKLSMLLWGMSKCGKTTLASTMPGKKLWINFDPTGLASVKGRSDIIALDLSGQPNKIVEEFKKEGILSAAMLEGIDSIVFDSLTTFGDKALAHGVIKAAQKYPSQGVTLEDPGFKGYGYKNTYTRECILNLLRVAAQNNKHICFIAHEDVPDKNQDGVVYQITIMLGSSLSQQAPVNISEVWHMRDTGTERQIAVRPFGAYRPMGTRMFDTTKATRFVWKYNAVTQQGEGIEQWYNAWLEATGKIPLPV